MNKKFIIFVLLAVMVAHPNTAKGNPPTLSDLPYELWDMVKSHLTNASDRPNIDAVYRTKDRIAYGAD
jgi:hypothetical protein